MERVNFMSQPARAVWIEILQLALRMENISSQPARAVWIEIHSRPVPALRSYRHSLRGLCGLK